MHALNLLALLLPLAAANTHGQDWIHNAGLTQAVCDSSFHKKRYAKFNPTTNRCEGLTNFWIDGKTWEDQCKSSGKGYVDAHGTHFKVGAAAGSCPDRP
ncbi:hypothetical protein E4U09_005790 [Claviceps aff. purpurea]|uniref:Uncharacterized protein n=1 Tax=Claviceps aff. purpurea TaxID=1967640 RepID=A0A9P7QNI4_9HYPO|nr:hypothetical protein E4U09_005790 [Claviceps aff. purpurea]